MSLERNSGFADAVKAVMCLPLSDTEKAEAVWQLLRARHHWSRLRADEAPCSRNPPAKSLRKKYDGNPLCLAHFISRACRMGLVTCTATKTIRR